MTSESIRIEQQLYQSGHRDRHTPHLCTECGHPMTSDGACTHCEAAAQGTAPERPILQFPDAWTRLERMERVAKS